MSLACLIWSIRARSSAKGHLECGQKSPGRGEKAEPSRASAGVPKELVATHPGFRTGAARRRLSTQRCVTRQADRPGEPVYRACSLTRRKLNRLRRLTQSCLFVFAKL